MKFKYLSKSQQIPFCFLMEAVSQGLMDLSGKMGELTKDGR